jgi:hypothetical protein
VTVLLATLLGGCMPKPAIHHFSTTPPVACPGDEVTLRWETNGPVRIQATPEVAALGGKEDLGHQTVTIHGPTRFRLEVSRVFGLEKQYTESEVLSPRPRRAPWSPPSNSMAATSPPNGIAAHPLSRPRLRLAEPPGHPLARLP